MQNTDKYKKNYSESGMWAKIGKFSSKMGKDTVLNVLKLYYAMKLGKATAAQIAIIIGAIGYLISPIDAIPDVIPVLGFTDDAGVLVAAIKMVGSCSDPEVVAAAEAKLKEWFN